MDLFGIKIFYLIAFGISLAGCFPDSLRVRLTDRDERVEKNFPIDSMIDPNKDFLAPQSVIAVSESFRKIPPRAFYVKNRGFIPNDVFLYKRDFGNLNPMFDGSKSQDDQWNNEDDSFDEGLWLNTVAQPQVEFPAIRSSIARENLAKKIKAHRQSLIENLPEY